nr:putative reverse transcriptase domain-containing protein [Tanacetum cinerariifolium]
MKETDSMEKLTRQYLKEKSYADRRHKPLEFEVGDKVMLKVSPWKGVIRFGKQGKLNPRYIGPFKILAKVGMLAYRLELSDLLSRVHSTFYVSNLKKCFVDEPLAIPLDEIQINDKLNFFEEPVKIMDREVKRQKQSCIPIVKVHVLSFEDKALLMGEECHTLKVLGIPATKTTSTVTTTMTQSSSALVAWRSNWLEHSNTSKVNVFLWRALKGIILVRMELDKNGVNMNFILCLWCDNNTESIDHTLVLCENAMKIWDVVLACGGIGPVNVFTSKEIHKHNGGAAVSKGAKKP